MKAVPNNKGVLIASNEPKGKLIEVGVGVGFGEEVTVGVGTVQQSPLTNDDVPVLTTNVPSTIQCI
jgi:hypothetical protein